jgi:tetratricopeptide (TPR) repeat protein
MLRFGTAILLCSFCAVLIHGQPLNGDSAALEVKRGKLLFVNGDYEAAILHYTKAIEIRPNFAEAYLRRGYAERMRNYLDEALRDFDKATELDPQITKNDRGVADAYTNRGEIRQTNLHLEEAISDCDKAIRSFPTLSRPYETRGLSRLLLEDFKGSITDFDSYLAREKYDSFGRALVYADRSFAKRMLHKEPGADSDLAESFRLAGKDSAGIEGRLQELQVQLILMRESRGRTKRVIG